MLVARKKIENKGKLKSAGSSGGTSCKLMSKLPVSVYLSTGCLCFLQILAHVTYPCIGLAALPMISIGYKCFQQDVGY